MTSMSRRSGVAAYRAANVGLTSIRGAWPPSIAAVGTSSDSTMSTRRNRACIP